MLLSRSEKISEKSINQNFLLIICSNGRALSRPVCPNEKYVFNNLKFKIGVIGEWMKIDAIAFDFDGTLIETNDVWHNGLNMTLKQYGKPEGVTKRAPELFTIIAKEQIN